LLGGRAESSGISRGRGLAHLPDPPLTAGRSDPLAGAASSNLEFVVGQGDVVQVLLGHRLLLSPSIRPSRPARSVRGPYAGPPYSSLTARQAPAGR
jgi:hypothetical protein